MSLKIMNLAVEKEGKRFFLFFFLQTARDLVYKISHKYDILVGPVSKALAY